MGTLMQGKKHVYIELEPQLDACVETQAKRQYNQLLRQLLKKDATTELMEKAEVLRLFLESVDFNRLRAESEKHLLAGRKVKFLVHRERGQPRYEMRVTGS
jgi:hypothetical protein